MENNKIVLGQESFDILPIPLGRVKKLIPAMNRVAISLSSGELTETAFDDAILSISLALNKPVAEIENIPSSFDEIVAAIEIIMEVAGLKKKESTPGEPVAAS